MARYPLASWRGSPNVGGTPVRPALGLCVHVEVGTEAGTDVCFRNPSFKASAHFGVDQDGSVDQWVDTDAEAWAEVAGNPGWISVETAGYPTDALTGPQVAALRQLFAWVRTQYPNVPAQTCDHDGTGLTTHAHYPSGAADPQWGGHPCPGAIRAAQLPSILGAPAPTSSSDVPEESMYDAKGHCVALIKPDGSVATYNADGSPGGHYLGGLNNHPAYNAGAGKPEGPAVSITPWDDGLTHMPDGVTPITWSGYVIWTEDAAGVFHSYAFPSDGRHAAAGA